jgi:hypothetical protein
MDAFSLITRLTCSALTTLAATSVFAQTQTSPTSVGPGRIICRSATACELDIGAPPSLTYRIDPSALAAPDKNRLTKQCTAKATPCVATVTGVETKTGVKAASIKFYN